MANNEIPTGEQLWTACFRLAFLLRDEAHQWPHGHPWFDTLKAAVDELRTAGWNASRDPAAAVEWIIEGQELLIEAAMERIDSIHEHILEEAGR